MGNLGNRLEILIWVAWLLSLDVARAAVDKFKLYKFQAGRSFLSLGQSEAEKALAG